MSGVRLAMHQREYGRGSPFLLLRALDAPQNVTGMPDQQLRRDQSHPAVAFMPWASVTTPKVGYTISLNWSRSGTTNFMSRSQSTRIIRFAMSAEHGVVIGIAVEVIVVARALVRSNRTM